jgi:hypothetical protein
LRGGEALQRSKVVPVQWSLIRPQVVLARTF